MAKRLAVAEFSVGWVCALPVELAAAIEMMDEEYSAPTQLSNDSNIYTFGRIGVHNVVAACLPAGQMGTSSAAVVTSQMQSSFPTLRFSLVVGVGGGVPSEQHDIRLGDVVISQPTGQHGGVVQFDFGKTGPEGRITRTGCFNVPPAILLKALAKMNANRMRNKTQVAEHLSKFSGNGRFAYPGSQEDTLYTASSQHILGPTCANCAKDDTVARPVRDGDEPALFLGNIASGNQVMRDGLTRDRISVDLGGVLCFEMEAAGLMNDFRCLVIRGICDYADAHKNKSWQPYAAATAAAYAKELLNTVPKQSPIGVIPHGRSESLPNPTVVLPFGRDKDFVRREAIMDQVHHLMAEPASRIALVGLGGVGKSQIAIEYAYQIREQSPETWVFWIHASNAVRYEQSFRDVAERAQIPGRQNPQNNIFQLVHNWLCSDQCGRWVVILDSADEVDFLLAKPSSSQDGQSHGPYQAPLVSYLPRSQNGSILITTRSRHMAQKLVEAYDIVAVEPMSQADALILMEKKLGKMEKHEDVKAATALTSVLECMPLAIVQATSYILHRAPRMSLQRYLDKTQQSDRRRAGLLDYEGGQLRRDYEAKNSIILTWQISFNHIQETRRSAAELLSIMSFCDRQGIPESLLRSSAKGSDEHNPGRLGEDEQPASDGNDESSGTESSDDNSESSSGLSDSIDEDISTLQDYSFISIDEYGMAFEMHSLVQLSMRKWLESQSQLEKWNEIFLSRLRAQIPTGNYENWTECRVYLPHAKAAARQRPKSESSLAEWAEIMFKSAMYLKAVGMGDEAQEMSEKAMTTSIHLFGRTNLNSLSAMTLVGSVHGLRGQWDEAEKLQVEVMETRKTVQGVDHPATLVAINNLALTYLRQGRWDEAEKLQIEVLNTNRAKPEADPSTMLINMGNLALTYSKQGRWEEAGELQIEVLEAQKARKGADHPDVLTSMNNLALTYSEQGRWEEVEKLQTKVVETRKAILGADHPSTLTSMNNLALTYRRHSRWDEAEKLQANVVESHKAGLGNHPNSLTGMENLASIYSEQGRWDEAERLQTKVVESRKARLGADHLSTLISMFDLALIYKGQGRCEEGEKLQAEALEAGKAKLEADRPATLTNVRNLISTYEGQGQCEEAENLLLKAVEMGKAISGASSE